MAIVSRVFNSYVKAAGFIGPDGPISGGSSLIHQATVTLTDAQIQSLPTVYVSLVPAPGTGKYLVPFEYGGLVHKVSPYDGVDVDAYLILVTGDWDVDAGAVIGGTALSGVQDDIFSAGANVFNNPAITAYPVAGLTNNSDLLDNAPLKLAANNGGDFTGGDAANFLTLGITFGVRDITTGLLLTTTASGWNQDTRSFS